jgi:hypothetical protein
MITGTLGGYYYRQSLIENLTAETKLLITAAKQTYEQDGTEIVIGINGSININNAAFLLEQNEVADDFIAMRKLKKERVNMQPPTSPSLIEAERVKQSAQAAAQASVTKKAENFNAELERLTKRLSKGIVEAGVNELDHNIKVIEEELEKLQSDTCEDDAVRIQAAYDEAKDAHFAQWGDFSF